MTGPDGLLAAITKNAIQAALEAEMTEHLGFERGDRAASAAAGGGNHRNGTSKKTVQTGAGPVELDIPRDRAGEFEPKHSRWVGDGGEGAKHWMGVLAELRNRGVEDVLVVCCDGLKGLPESIGEIWPQALVQLCVVHLVRASLKYAAKRHWGPISKALRAVYTAPTVEAVERQFGEFKTAWGGQYPMIVRTWESAWEQFTPFLAFPPEIRRVIYTTNMIESMNARFRQTVRRRGHFPSDQAALKVLYLVIRDRQKNRPNVIGKTHGWKRALQQFALYFGDRVTAQTEH
nr:IS256 family transposase [Glycomyces amatae]